jgi:hypothetical protein
MSSCKCGARSYEVHVKRTADGYPGHTYKGPLGALVHKGE